MVESLTNEIICGSGPYWEWLEYLFTLYMYMYKHVHIPNRPMRNIALDRVSCGIFMARTAIPIYDWFPTGSNYIYKCLCHLREYALYT